MSTSWWSQLHAEEGASSVEYGILAAAVGIVLVAAGPALADAFLELIRFITGGFSR
jgi:Flp pilus assembly pilin Flp